MDCGVGPEGSAIAGLWYLEALGIPAAVADVMTAHLGDGVHLYNHGVVSFVNQLALDCGVSAGMAVRDAAAALLDNDPVEAAASEITNRTIMETAPDGRCVVAADSIAFGTSRGHRSQRAGHRRSHRPLFGALPAPLPPLRVHLL